MQKGQSLTQDAILGGRIRLWQPAQGYRASIDPVFLAASIPTQEKEMVLDIGTGSGAAALCLVTRVPGCQVVGLELQWDMIRLATQNIEENSLQGRMEVLHGDLIHPPPRLAPSTFHHVMANPPFYDAVEGTASAVPQKQTSHALPEGMTSLKQWIHFAHLMVRPKGSITFVYPVDRLDGLITLLHGKLGCLSIYPLWMSHTRPAKRVLVRGIKGIQGPTKLMRGLCLHDTQGKFTPEAEAVLRHAQAVVF